MTYVLDPDHFDSFADVPGMTKEMWEGLRCRLGFYYCDRAGRVRGRTVPMPYGDFCNAVFSLRVLSNKCGEGLLAHGQEVREWRADAPAGEDEDRERRAMLCDDQYAAAKKSGGASPPRYGGGYRDAAPPVSDQEAIVEYVEGFLKYLSPEDLGTFVGDFVVYDEAAPKVVRAAVRALSEADLKGLDDEGADPFGLLDGLMESGTQRPYKAMWETVSECLRTYEWDDDSENEDE